MGKVNFFGAGSVGIIKDLPAEEIHPKGWSDGRGFRFDDDKAYRMPDAAQVFGTPIAAPYWLMPVQAGTAAYWMYGGIGSSGNDSSTKILLHFEGADASTTFTDSPAGASAHTFTAAGNAQIDTADKFHGGASGLFDGTGDWITTPDSADFLVDVNAFQVDVNFKINGGDGTILGVCGQNDVGITAAGTSFYIRRNAANAMTFAVSDGTTITTITSAGTYTTAVNTGWHHLRAVRIGTALTLLIDGLVVATGTMGAGAVPNSASVFGVGVTGASAANGWFGWLDEFRLQIGGTISAAEFTPPREPFGTSASNESRLYITDGASHADITRVITGVETTYTVDTTNLWNGGILSGIPVITNGLDVPQMFVNPSLTTRAANLTAWPAADRCEVIRPFKGFLVAANITRSSTNYPHIVKWSHPAVPGAVPSTWDETDPTKLAGEVEIVDEFPGIIKDALILRDILVIYKDNTVWGMQYIGGNSIFRFYPIFINSGIMARHCVCAIDQGAAHFVLTGEDIIIHDGQNSKSVLDRKMRRFIFNTIPPARSQNCFVVALPEKSEAWAFITVSGDTYPSLAVIYNWRKETTTLKALSVNTSYAAVGPVAANSDPWDADSGTWASDTTTWDTALFSAHFMSMIATQPSSTRMVAIEDTATFSGGAGTVYLERTGIAVTGQDKVTGELKADNDAMKLMSRIWVKATGGAFNVQIGGAEFKGQTVNYQAAQQWTPGTTKYLDFYPVNARFLALKFSNIGSSDTEFVIEGFDLDIEVLGEQ